jgi:hypothetical protein
MEPRGCNRWQPVATGRKCTSSKRRAIKPKRFAVGCDRLPKGAHGKEGVEGSSPSEGLKESPANRHVVLPVMARLGFFGGYETGTFWDRRVLAGTRDISGHLTVVETVDRDHSLEKFLQTGGRRCPRWRDADSLLR